jgi:branched-chain amino acid transport system ATP-binding protein
MENGLVVEDLSISYGAIRAVLGISLTVAPSEIVAVVGRNGAGKSSTLRAISGFLSSEGVRVQATSLALNGVSFLGRRPSWVASNGIAIVPERDKVFPSLTVEENLIVALPRGHRGGIDMAYSYFPPLAKRRSSRSGYLSGGERQMLAIARALMWRPKLLLADELSFGLAPTTVRTLVERISTVCREEKLSLLLAEQSFDVASTLATRIYVMETGHVVASGSPDELLAQRDADASLLGLQL